MKLDARQKKELKASIKHWKEDIIVWLEGGYVTNGLYWCDGERTKVGGQDCPLCRTYYNSRKAAPCGKCPFECIELWNSFVGRPTLTNARKMVKAMEKILKEGA